MISHTTTAIIAIVVIIPLSSIAVWNTAQSIELIEEPLADKKIIALASFYPLYEFTNQVGGDNVNAFLLVPFGVEPHDWEPTIQDLQRIQRADLILINGLGFENWIQDVTSINPDVIIVDTSNNISIIGESRHESEKGHSLYSKSFGDPHIWLNPIMAKIQVENIAQSLIQIDPENQKLYSQNADSYIKKLDLLDNKIKRELADCKKDFISFHNSFSYFSNQYGLNQHTIINSNEPHGEPKSKTLERVINLAKDLELNVIFTEEAVDPRTSQVIANEIGGKVITLSPLEVVDSQSTYLEKMEQNLSNLKEALCN